jgi:hypothetical protein
MPRARWTRVAAKEIVSRGWQTARTVRRYVWPTSLEQQYELVAGLSGGTNAPQSTEERVTGTDRSGIW